MYRNPLVKGSARQLLFPAPLSANGGLEPNQPVRFVLDTIADFLGGSGGACQRVSASACSAALQPNMRLGIASIEWMAAGTPSWGMLCLL